MSDRSNNAIPYDARTRRRVSFVDLRAQLEPLQDEIKRAVEEVLRRCDFILGEETLRFERAFGEYLGADHVVGVGNGLDALRLSLTALNIGSGDEVILPVNTFVATAFAASGCGARPVFVDCDPQTYNLDVRQIADLITSRTKAVVAVHLAGRAADMEALAAVAEKHGVHVLEDVAQATGAALNGRRCGTLSQAGCFSFYPAKNLGALGDAGAVATNDSDMAERIRRLRHYGQRRRYEHVELGCNSRLDTIQAAVLNVKLRYLDVWNAARYAHAAWYREQLTGVGDLAFPASAAEGAHVHHLCIVETGRRDALQAHLESCDIETLIHYPLPLHLQAPYRELGYRRGDFPAAERAAERMLSLPLYPELPAAHREYVVDSIRRWFES